MGRDVKWNGRLFPIHFFFLRNSCYVIFRFNKFPRATSWLSGLGHFNQHFSLSRRISFFFPPAPMSWKWPPQWQLFTRPPAGHAPVSLTKVRTHRTLLCFVWLCLLFALLLISLFLYVFSVFLVFFSFPAAAVKLWLSF